MTGSATTQDAGSRTQDPGLRMQDPGLRMQDSGSRTQDPGPQQQGLFRPTNSTKLTEIYYKPQYIYNSGCSTTVLKYSHLMLFVDYRYFGEVAQMHMK